MGVVGVSVHRQEGTRVPARGPGVVTSWGGKVAAGRGDRSGPRTVGRRGGYCLVGKGGQRGRVG